MRTRLAASLAVLLIVVGMAPVYALQPVIEQERAADCVVFGWVAQMQELYTEAPKMVQTGKGFALDRGKPAGTQITFLADTVLKGKMQRGMVQVFRTIPEGEKTPLFYKNARLVLFLKKMPAAEIARLKLSEGDHYTLAGNDGGVISVEDEAGKDLANAVGLVIKIDAIVNPKKRAEQIAQNFAMASPVQIRLLMSLLSEINPEPALLGLYSAIETNPDLSREAAASLEKMDSDGRKKLITRFKNAKKAGLRAMAVELLATTEMPEKAEILKALAADPDPRVREAVARVAAALDAVTRDTILEPLMGDPSPK